MLKMGRLTLSAITLLGGVATATAQTSQDRAGPPPGASAPSMPSASPMMPPGGQAGSMPTMDRGRMMGGDMPAMMRRMMSGSGGVGMMPGEHIKGRVAFLKAELGITDAQLPQWNAYADALQASDKSMQMTMAKMMEAGMPATAPARTDAMIEMMTARLAAMKTSAEFGKGLYAVLTDAQKKIADELTTGPMGRM